jgi:hypothetical protein
MEPVPQFLELRANLEMVVDLAVERNGRVSIVAQKRLIAAGQIDDLQSDGAQRRFAALEDPLLVWSPMVQRFRDAVGNTPVHGPTKASKSRDSTHYD